jgi:hypothetical protein
MRNYIENDNINDDILNNCYKKGNICYQDNEYQCECCFYMCCCACAEKEKDFCICTWFDGIYENYSPRIKFNDEGGCFSKYFLINFLCVCLIHVLVWFLVLYFYMIPCFSGQIT